METWLGTEMKLPCWARVRAGEIRELLFTGESGHSRQPVEEGKTLQRIKPSSPPRDQTQHLRSYLTQRREEGEEKMKKRDKEAVDHLLWAGHPAEL